MENQFKQTEFTPEVKQWIAEQDAIMRQESLTYAIEAQVEAIEAQTAAIQAQTAALQALSTRFDDVVGSLDDLSQRFAPCDFTRWNIAEALANLALTLDQMNKNK